MSNQPKTIPEEYISQENIYRAGWAHGHGFACHNVPKIGETYWFDHAGEITCDADNIREVHEVACFEAEDNSRQYSPFELIAHELNEGEDSEELWEAFNAGLSDAIRHDLASYTDEDYGIA
jgi:hypothetical protein